ncbi:Mut7-C RNAse domain-containing protein [Halovenus salina]|uniref:Mut7-C RNAse domain-containing protein n=1 Tax=Halovenus salina TaxID=1510225 RepID=UPI00226101E2|nr:Mut7-C RNAse domain-containing protein [Halovenus salina]
MSVLTDAMLGGLTTYLRMCGYDTVYVLDADLETDDEIRNYAEAEERTLLTRDEALAARTEGALLLESREIKPMLSTLVAAGFELSLPEAPERCSLCNGIVEGVDADEPTPEYAPGPQTEDVWWCTACGQHFWKGSHWDDVTDTLRTARENP